MQELFSTNNVAALSFARDLLAGHGIESVVLDEYMSYLVPRRLMVRDEDLAAARRLIVDRGLADDVTLSRGGTADPVDNPVPVGLGPLTQDRFLGGRLSLLQPKTGFRAAIDSVLLPAAVSAQNGLSVLDAGLGAGVAALCLLARVPDFRVSGIEVQEDLCALAAENARSNHLRLTVRCADLFRSAMDPARPRFDQVMTNPPYHEQGAGTPPPDAAKARANMMAGEIGGWIAACLAHLKPGGVLTLIHRADRLNAILAALSGAAGDVRVFPLWPGTGKPAKRVIVQARCGANGGIETLAGLVLHGADTKFTEAAEAVLRHGGALSLA
jgi:tRNA1(Val) A37 N6-methylase TrmN6